MERRVDMSNLKDRREASGLSQSELAFISGVSVRMIQYYEQGRNDINKAQAITLYAIARAMKCKIEDLLER